MAKKKYYAVAAGRETGIFTDWPTAERQVKGFAGAKFKSFATRIEAESWLHTPVYVRKSTKIKKAQSLPESIPGLENAIVIHTDGGCINNPGPGGYGVVISDGENHRELSGGFRLTTNNRMEMTACIVAVQEMLGSGRPIILYSDSSYLVNGITKGWAKKWRAKGWKKADGDPALNPDLWAQLLDLLEHEDVHFHWVKGHAGNVFNERCDALAVSFARKPDLPKDRGYEQSLK